MSSFTLAPTAPPIAAYYERLQSYHQQQVTNELAIRQAFAILLDEVAKMTAWTLVLEQSLGNHTRPDGEIRDALRIPRGYWEAKDTADDLDTEIQAKIAKGYPTFNTIFENSERGVLYQHGKVVLDVDLRHSDHLAKLLSHFFSYSGADIEKFHAAVRDFQERIPDLAQGLIQRIEQELEDNKQFRTTFDKLHKLCQHALYPTTPAEVVQEMLVQHLLTERLFRTIFNNPDFVQRNIIAAEIEKVIAALTSRAFSRSDFLGQLDTVYYTIEDNAKRITDFTAKQPFLNVVYERFFHGFSTKQADTHGIIYTPQAIVDFMCASVEEVLQQEFNLTLNSPTVQILDPCVGTGNFMLNLIKRISMQHLTHKYEQDLFCNEVLLLPYYIATLNIEHTYFELMGHYKPFPGISFVDTLNLAEKKRKQLLLFNEENSQRVERQKKASLMVIIGNPPYNVGQQNENDNNKNRPYTVIDQRIRETYAKDSQATNKNALSDAYVKFFRWAVDRLKDQDGNLRDGIICYVTNNSFLDQIAFDGFRKHLLQDFTHIYHLDLHGNVRQNPKLSGTKHNVFGIQVGVGITIAIRNQSNPTRFLRYFRVPETWDKDEKYAFLAEKGDVYKIAWQELQPNAKHHWLTDGLHADFAPFLPMGTKEAKVSKSQWVETIFKTYSNGVKTNRDIWAYNFTESVLIANIQRFIATYNAEVDRWHQRSDKQTSIDNFVQYNDTEIKWSEGLKNYSKRGIQIVFDTKKVRNSLYRSFCKQNLYFERYIVERVYQFPHIFPTPASEAENVVICVNGIGGNKKPSCLATSTIVDLGIIEATQCFPFYTYDEDGSNRRENITAWAVQQFATHYGMPISKWDIFHYTYALLHHPIYRERYAENLKRELPRIPMLGTGETFTTLVSIGQRLMHLHLNYETVEEYPLEWVENKAQPWSWRVRKMKLTKDKTALIVNNNLTLRGIPPAAFAYQLGNRSALEWVIDQYQVKTDKRSGITNDPNRADAPDYIAQLVGRVVQVSVETVALVEQVAAVATLPD